MPLLRRIHPICPLSPALKIQNCYCKEIQGNASKGHTSSSDNCKCQNCLKVEYLLYCRHFLSKQKINKKLKEKKTKKKGNAHKSLHTPEQVLRPRLYLNFWLKNVCVIKDWITSMDPADTQSNNLLPWPTLFFIFFFSSLLVQY